MVNYNRRTKSCKIYEFEITSAKPSLNGIDLVLSNRRIGDYNYEINPKESREFRENLGVSRTRELKGKRIKGIVSNIECESKLVQLIVYYPIPKYQQRKKK